MNLLVETDGIALKYFIYLFIFSRRSQEHCVEQYYPMPGVVWFFFSMVFLRLFFRPCSYLL